MRDQNAPFSLFLGLCACLVLSGCFQGYGENVSSQEELNTLLLSLTPGAQAIVSPAVQSTFSIEQSTRVPTLPPPTATTASVIMEGGMIIHIVKEGEILFNIAQQYGVTVEALSAMNNITDPNSLYVDQALIIPQATPIPPTQTEESTQTSMLPTASVTPLSTETPIPSATPSPTLEPQLDAQSQTTHIVETGETLFQISKT
jgi:hypothetical protein